MYSTTAYLYNQKHKIILLDTGGDYHDLRWRPVYAKNLKISKGIDNTVLIQFLNQAQKAVDVTNIDFTFRIMDREGTSTLLEKQLIVTDAAKGKTQLVITSQELDHIQPQRANYSIEYDQGLLTNPVYVDDNADSRGTIEIADSVYPSFVESLQLLIPTNQTNPISSVWQPSAYLQTIQYQTTDFIGTMQIQASSAGSSTGDWYNVSTLDFGSSNSTTGYLNIEGFYPYMRISIEKTSGSVSNIYVR